MHASAAEGLSNNLLQQLHELTMHDLTSCSLQVAHLLLMLLAQLSSMSFKLLPELLLCLLMTCLDVTKFLSVSQIGCFMGCTCLRLQAAQLCLLGLELLLK